MTDAPASEAALNQTLRRAHRSALVSLAACAGVIALTAEPGPTALAESSQRLYAFAAAALGVASILTRRRTAPAGYPRSYVTLSLASLLCACGVGLVGVALAVAGGARTTTLLFVVAAVMFALRPPFPIEVPPPPDGP